MPLSWLLVGFVFSELVIRSQARVRLSTAARGDSLTITIRRIGSFASRKNYTAVLRVKRVENGHREWLLKIGNTFKCDGVTYALANKGADVLVGNLCAPKE